MALFQPQYFEQIPIADYTNEKEKLIEKSENQISKTASINKKIARFLHRLQTNLNPMGHDPLNEKNWKLSKKLQSFYDYDFATFLKELKKKKIKLKLSEQDEWEDYFNDYKTAINQLQAEINKTDKEIDRMVYELYSLTDEEIKIVEGA